MHMALYAYGLICIWPCITQLAPRCYSICLVIHAIRYSQYIIIHTCYRVQSIQDMWDSLLYKLDSRKGTLTRQRDLMTVFNEMDECLTDMGIIQVSVNAYMYIMYIYIVSIVRTYVCSIHTCVIIVCYYIHSQMSLQSEDYGKHLLSVQDLLEKHSLLEADIVTINERVKAINSQANKFIDQGLFCAIHT